MLSQRHGATEEEERGIRNEQRRVKKEEYMKRFFVLCMAALLAACGGAPAPRGNPLEDLDAAIREASAYINQRIPDNSTG
jgi:hypothetical protein